MSDLEDYYYIVHELDVHPNDSKYFRDKMDESMVVLSENLTFDELIQSGVVDDSILGNYPSLYYWTTKTVWIDWFSLLCRLG